MSTTYKILEKDKCDLSITERSGEFDIELTTPDLLAGHDSAEIPRVNGDQLGAMIGKILEVIEWNCSDDVRRRVYKALEAKMMFLNPPKS